MDFCPEDLTPAPSFVAATSEQAETLAELMQEFPDGRLFTAYGLPAVVHPMEGAVGASFVHANGDVEDFGPFSFGTI